MNRLQKLVIVLAFVFWGSMCARAYASTSVGSFTLTGNTAHQLMIWEAPDVTTMTAGTNGQVIVGSTGADPVFATLGTGTGISTTTGAGTLTINNTGVTSAVAGSGIGVSGATGAVTISNNGVTSAVAGTGITVSGATGAVTFSANGQGTLTVVTKTGNYSVVSGDSGTVFDTTGASAEVDFTLPTAAAGLWYTFHCDAAQTMKIIAGASTTIRLGGAVSASAGNVSVATVGYNITLVAIDTTHWIALRYVGTWTVT